MSIEIEEIIDTAALVNHDLLGHLHVLNFCIDQLKEQAPEELKVIVQKMSRNTDRLSATILNYRGFLKFIQESAEEITMEEALNKALLAVRVHHFQAKSKFDIKLQAIKGDTILRHPSLDIVLSIFSLVSTQVGYLLEQGNCSCSYLLEGNEKVVKLESNIEMNPDFMSIHSAHEDTRHEKLKLNGLEIYRRLNSDGILNVEFSDDNKVMTLTFS